MAAITGLFTPNWAAAWSAAGAIMDEDVGLINAYAETRMVTVHFLPRLQLGWSVSTSV